MFKKLLKQEKGIGGILIIAAVIFVIIAIAVMAYFLLNGKKTNDSSKAGSVQSGSNGSVISDEQVPLKICETGDLEECNDPVSNADVDNVVLDDLP